MSMIQLATSISSHLPLRPPARSRRTGIIFKEDDDGYGSMAWRAGGEGIITVSAEISIGRSHDRRRDRSSNYNRRVWSPSPNSNSKSGSGPILKEGFTTLPSFKVSEAKEAAEVCRILLEEGGNGDGRERGSAKPNVQARRDRALSALLPKLQTRVLARILKQQTRPRMAWKLFRWAQRQPSFTHDHYTFYALIHALGKAGDLDGIWTVVDDMRNAGLRVKPIPFTILISSYAKLRMLKEAEMTLHTMREFHCKPNVFTYNAILFALLHNHRPDRAMFTFSKMLHSGCVPDETTFNTLITGFCANDRVESADFFLQEMLKQGLLPDLRMFNTVMAGYLKQSSIQGAIRIYEQAMVSDNRPNTVTYTILLQWLFRMGKAKDALHVFDQMVSSKSCQLDTVSYTTLIHGLLKSGESMLGFSIFKRLAEQGHANVATFNIVVDWLCKEKRLEEAAELVQKMENGSPCPDTFTYNSLMLGYAKAAQSNVALQTVDRMISRGCCPDMVTYTWLIEFFCKAGEINDAWALMDEMICNGYEPDAVVYNPLLRVLLKGGKLELALSLASSMIERGCRPNEMTFHIMNSWPIVPMISSQV